MIKLKYYGVNPALCGHEPQQVELPAYSTIEQLVNIISDKIQDPVDVLLQSAVFLVNKSNAKKNTTLADGDEVFILYGIAGG